MEQYGRSKQEVLELTKSGEGGLTSAEAEKRLAQNGRNVLQEGKKRSKLLLFLAQFADLMTIILILAAALSAVLAFVTGDRTELADTGILLFVILLNAVVGFLQQYRADAAIEKLKKLSACEGHTVGVHSATHNYSDIYASDEALLADVNECATLIRRVTGVVPHVYRFPGGGTSARERQTKMLERLGYRVVRWNAVCGDEEIRNASAATLTEESMRTAGNKNTVVLLLHDSAPHRATAEALPDIISRFRARGYTFCAY